MTRWRVALNRQLVLVLAILVFLTLLVIQLLHDPPTTSPTTSILLDGRATTPAVTGGGGALDGSPDALSMIYVPEDHPTIQAAIDAAQTGDLIVVAPGTYNEALLIAGKTVVLASEFYTSGDRSLIDTTVIDGGIIVESDAAGTLIIGFTIQNGSDGIKPHGAVTVSHNRIRWNSDGIDFEGGTGSVVEHNILEENNDDGIDLDGATGVEIRHNTIRNNSSDGIEMRIHPYSGTSLLQIVVSENAISANGDDGLQIIEDLGANGTTNRLFVVRGNVIADNGGAALGFLDNGDTNQDYRAVKVPDPVYFINNTVVGNDHGVSGSGTDLVVVNNIFADQTNVALKQVDGGSVAAHNLFWSNGTDAVNSNVEASTSVYADPRLDVDYTLLSASEAIDAGTKQYAHKGRLVVDILPNRYSGSAPDLGAQESGFEAGINQAPDVNAGPDQAVNPPALVQLVGEASDDGLPDPPAALTTTWGVVSGPGSVRFGDASVVDPSVTFSAVGVYVLRLTADDGELRSIDEVSVVVTEEGVDTTVDVQVSADADDGEEREDGSVQLNSSDLELVFDQGGNQVVGMRFSRVTIPQGATILSAYVQFKVDETTTGTTTLLIQGQAADDAPTFTSAAFGISSRARTDAGVTWVPEAWTTAGETGPDQQTADLALVIQEIIDRSGWNSGNSLVLIISGTGERVAEAHNGDPAGAPLLHVVYTVG